MYSSSTHNLSACIDSFPFILLFTQENHDYVFPINVPVSSPSSWSWTLIWCLHLQYLCMSRIVRGSQWIVLFFPFSFGVVINAAIKIIKIHLFCWCFPHPQLHSFLSPSSPLNVLVYYYHVRIDIFFCIIVVSFPLFTELILFFCSSYKSTWIPELINDNRSSCPFSLYSANLSHIIMWQYIFPGRFSSTRGHWYNSLSLLSCHCLWFSSCFTR